VPRRPPSRAATCLVAAGRQANVEGLGLEAAGIEYTGKGVKTDESLRTTNKKVWAVGDVAGRQQFTHIAGYHASVVIRQILFRLPAKVDDKAVPWVTYTDPELAHVGLTAAMAKERGLELKPLTFAYAENDRARAERHTEGFAKAWSTARAGSTAPRSWAPTPASCSSSGSWRSRRASRSAASPR
jgi:pyruvate/2-oxoglutarate dehydrogenase complex dihydrolipoamide dehydrogenase (E3) component